jgi:hypothetical protein
MYGYLCIGELMSNYEWEYRESYARSEWRLYLANKPHNDSNEVAYIYMFDSGESIIPMLYTRERTSAWVYYNELLPLDKLKAVAEALVLMEGL